MRRLAANPNQAVCDLIIKEPIRANLSHWVWFPSCLMKTFLFHMFPVFSCLDLFSGKKL